MSGGVTHLYVSWVESGSLQTSRSVAIKMLAALTAARLPRLPLVAQFMPGRPMPTGTDDPDMPGVAADPQPLASPVAQRDLCNTGVGGLQEIMAQIVEIFT